MKYEHTLKNMDHQLMDHSILAAYEKQNFRKVLFVALILILIIISALIAITIGPIKMTLEDSLHVVFHHILPFFFEAPNSLVDGVVWQVRVPRVLTGFMVGFGLAISGAVMQPILRNPMATPYTLGISSAAGFGAALVIGFGGSLVSGASMLVVSAFAFSLLVVMIITTISKWKSATPEIIILTGIALSYLFNAGIRLLQYLVDPIYTKEMVFWLAGSLYKGNWENLLYISIAVFILSAYLIYKSKELNAMSAGDEVATSVGINVSRTRINLLIASSMLTAVLVSFTGTIGFIGLVAPHITRMILDGDNVFVVIGSGFVGAFLVIISDIIALNIIAPTSLPIGVITAFMGVPLFLYLIFRMKRGK